MMWNSMRALEHNVFPAALAAAFVLHGLVVIGLVLAAPHRVAEPQLQALAVMEFPYDPMGGAVRNAGEGLASASPSPSGEAALPDPPETERVAVASASEQAQLAPVPVPKKKKQLSKTKKEPERASSSREKTPSVSGLTERFATGGSFGNSGGNALMPQGQQGYGGGTGQGDANALRVYIGVIERELKKNKKYPPTARARQLQGTTTVSFTIRKNGEIVASSLLKSSGHSSLDNEAMKLLERISPLPAIPLELGRQTLTLDVPIEFHLRELRSGVFIATCGFAA